MSADAARKRSRGFASREPSNNAEPTFDASEIRSIGAIVAELLEDILRTRLDGMNAKGRKRFLMDLKARGAITDEDLAYWFYVYPDMRAA